MTVSVLAARTLFCYRMVIVRSSCSAHTIDITPCGASPVPEQELHGRHKVSVEAPCGLFTSAIQYDPGISHGRHLEICDRVGYGRRGIVRCLKKNDNRTTRTLSYSARSICD